MADYYDYNAPPGVFVPPSDPDSSGIYILEEPKSFDGSRGEIHAYDRPMQIRRSRYRDKFHGGPEDDAYARGSPKYGYPGFRGLTSSRENRPAIDNIMSDPRPGAMNHLKIQKNSEIMKNVATQQKYVDNLKAKENLVSQKPPEQKTITLEQLKIILFVVIIILLAMWVMVKSTEKALACTLKEMLLEAMMIKGIKLNEQA